LASNADPPSYEAFYDRAHAYSEVLLVEASRVFMACELISRMVERLFRWQLTNTRQPALGRMGSKQ
jgi:hypothetical protein